MKDRQPHQKSNGPVSVSGRSRTCTAVAGGLQPLGSPVPTRHVWSVPWMGFEPMLSTVRAWRPLRAGPPGQPSVAQGGVEPPASQVLSLGGLPVAYRASRPPPCQRALVRRPRWASRVPGGSRTRLSGLGSRRLGRSATGTSFSGRRGSRTLKARRSSGFGPGAVASRLALPLQSGWLDLNQRGPAPGAGG